MKRPNKKEETKLYKKGFKYIAGVDEAGRGALAGPIVGAAVIFRKGIKIKGLNDSKKLTPQKREKLCSIIKKRILVWSVAQIKNKEIDKNGIHKANHSVLEKAVKKLKIKPQFLLIDAYKIKSKIPSHSIIKGDEKVFSIAAASILAKVTRDRIMEKQDGKLPKYKFIKHKGYGTKEHLKAIKKHGACPLHRKSFKPLNNL